MSAGIPYSQHVRSSARCVDASRAMFGGVPTPLTEIVAPTLYRLPADIGAQLKRDFWKRHGVDQEVVIGRVVATDWSKKYAAQDLLAVEVAEFEREKLHVAFDEHEIRSRATRWSELCGKMLRVEVMQDFARSVGIEPPEVRKNVTRVGAARRLSCPRWWRRQIRKTYTRRAESHLRARGFVHKRRQVYASDRAVENRRQRKARDRALLQDLLAVSNEGDQLELWEVVAKSQANPALRRAELMTRLSGFEGVAKIAGHEALFVTPTAPSAYHRTLASGEQNPRWENFTPRQGQDWLCRMWARARAKLARLSVSYYGFRIAEPHHDGTPHWHMVLFVPKSSVEVMQTVLRLVWLSEYADEAGAEKCRIKFERIRPEAGSATGYLAKYVAKNIDGFEVGDDYETQGQKASESCDRVAAWASVHGIRQFQQIGGPPVTVWRECRRLRSEIGGHPTIEAARKAADAGEWADFITALGGIERGRGGSVQLWTECTGELNQYDELPTPQVAGVECSTSCDICGGPLDGLCPTSRETACPQRQSSGQPCVARVDRVRTRTKVWRIKRKAAESSSGQLSRDRPVGSARAPLPSLGPVSITVRVLKSVPPRIVEGAHASPSNKGPAWMH